MDYVLGSVAALVTGNVTPNRPKLMKRALTPTKHQPSPNVTPKSEFVEDRSIFLSPNMQKKKAIVKKSPKRIFQNPELENPENGDGNVSLTSPKADKVKKHLKDELEADSSISSQKSPKKKGNNKRESTSTQENDVSITEQNDNENTPKKKKKKLNSESETTGNVSTETTDNVITEHNAAAAKSPKKRKQRRKSLADPDTAKENETSNEPPLDKSPKKQDNKSNVSVPTEKNNDATDTSNANTPKKKLTKSERRRLAKARAASGSTENKDKESEEPNKENIQKENQVETKKKKNRKRKKSKGQQNQPEKMDTDEPKPAENDNEEATNKSETENKEQDANKENQVAPKKKKNRNRKKSKGKQNEPQKMDTDEPKPVESENEEEDDDSEENAVPQNPVNPNAITDKESDSEHESDDEIESENEEINKKVLESEKPEVSSDEEDEEPKKKQKKEVEKKEDDGEFKKGDVEEVKRTLFVGNVPFNPKVKKEMKKIFGKHGQIETIRIRTVPIKDARYTPKLAVIKNELHPERSTVNVYIKYTDAESVEKALVENNTVLNENHLRVTRSSSTGVEHDPNMSIFVGNMPYAMEDEAFRAIFEKCGEIKSVRIIRDQKTNAGKGFGYVNFESKDAVELALALSEEDLTVKNRIMRVKRVTQTASSKKPVKNNTGQKHSGYKGGNHQPNQQGGGGFNNKANQQRGGFKGNQGNQQGGFRSGNDNQQRGGNNQRFQQRNGPPSRNNQGNRQRAFAGGNDQQRGGFSNKSGDQKNLSQKDEHGRDGAYRRVMNKRKNEENGGGDAPPNKIQKEMNEPREKKSRKEFVGMTAEKKKKRKFDKGQKKKKALSEILTK